MVILFSELILDEGTKEDVTIILPSFLETFLYKILTSRLERSLIIIDNIPNILRANTLYKDTYSVLTILDSNYIIIDIFKYNSRSIIRINLLIK